MKNSKLLAVIGASSMVGSRFCDLYNHKIIKGDHNQYNIIDITSKDSVISFFQNNHFENIILFSAYTDVKGAEEQRDEKTASCWELNVKGVMNIVNACNKYSKKMIFISTDFVFDGVNGPYSEDDPVSTKYDKISWYGLSKIEAEKEIRNNIKEYIILRISYPYRSTYSEKDDIAKRILKLFDNHDLYPMYTDQVFTPTFIDDIPKAVELLLSKDKKGIYHLASPSKVSQYDFAKYLLKKFDRDPINLKKALLKNDDSVPRPINGGLKSNKIISLGFTPINWNNGIDEIYTQSNGQLI